MKIIDVSDEVWMWMHQKYGLIWSVQKLYFFETNNWSYLSVNGNDQFNQQKNDTYYLQCKNSKIVMK